MPERKNTSNELSSRPFSHPAPCELPESKDRLKKIDIDESDSFLDILNKLLKVYHHESPTFNYEILRDCLSSIWENEYRWAIDERMLHSDFSKQAFTRTLIALILTARSQ